MRFPRPDFFLALQTSFLVFRIRVDFFTSYSVPEISKEIK